MNAYQNLEFIRNEIAHEFTLLNGRVIWLASCQSFLITAFVLALSSSAIYHAGWLAQFLLPLLGFSLCILVLPGIVAAHSTVRFWLEKQHTLLSQEVHSVMLAPITIERFRAHPHADRMHRVSLWFSLSLPIIMGVFWMVSFALVHITPLMHTSS